MDLFEITLLAAVQGVAEFLPISSSGHLVILSQWLGDQGADAALNVLLHAGTLGSILVHYRKDLLGLLSTERRLLPLLVLGTLPAVVGGLWIKRQAPDVLESPLIAGWMLLVTASILLLSRFWSAGQKELGQLGIGDVLWIGVWQAGALLPGISRSGATIVAGLLRGLRRDEAARWAFLLAIPAIAGATLLEAIDVVSGKVQTVLTPSGATLGLVVSFVVGLFSLRLVLWFVQQDRLAWFAVWCAGVGIGILIWLG